MANKTMSCILEGPANALATNKDASQVAVAGRNVFKVFDITNDEFVERMNLRVGKNLNLNFSCSDVAWNSVDDHILATAATNGAVVTWNLNKSSRSKQDMVFQDHKRTVNKVCFHPTEPNILLSGSQDGTMKIFDIRKREAAATFLSSSESVRDVQFCPHNSITFVAVQENGNVQIWDLRRTDKCERQFTAHSGPVFTCDWHPEERKLLATGSRDKTIKVWDISAKPVVSYCIQTIASVAHVKWRPQRKFHLASSSLVVDFSINVWDVRRPYVPFAAFTEHKDVATGFAWRSDPKVLLSTSKDSTLYQHVFQDAVRPADRANELSVAHTVGCYGDVAFVTSDRSGETTIRSKASPPYSSAARFPAVFKKAPSLADQFSPSSSALVVFSNDVEAVSMDWFLETAKSYQLCARPLPELCEHNAAVATRLNRHHIAQTWKILKTLYCSEEPRPSGGEFLGLGLADARGAEADRSSQEGAAYHASRHNSNTTRSRNFSGGGKKASAAGVGVGRHLAAERQSQPVQEASHNTGDETASSGLEDETTLTYIASGMGNAQGDFFFSEDGDIGSTFGFNLQALTLDDANQDWTLPNEAFELRHPIRDSPPVPDLGHDKSSPTSADDDDFKESRSFPSELDDHTKVLTISRPLVIPPWNPKEIVIEMLYEYVDEGDVQTSVSVMIVLGEKLKGYIEESTYEAWLLAYIGLLSHFQLWNVTAQVIQLCNVPSVSCLSQQSTSMHTQCITCKRPVSRVPWYCDRCKALAGACAVCHEPVRGLYIWCQGCCHGGHIHHMREWFQKWKMCPSGCGHLCEYT
ncbi:GATOR2 complex protein WDR24-like isoform X2 [Ornithodoros turicata]